MRAILLEIVFLLTYRGASELILWRNNNIRKLGTPFELIFSLLPGTHVRIPESLWRIKSLLN